jgi:hypothetical protein
MVLISEKMTLKSNFTVSKPWKKAKILFLFFLLNSVNF